MSDLQELSENSCSDRRLYWDHLALGFLAYAIRKAHLMPREAFKTAEWEMGSERRDLKHRGSEIKARWRLSEQIPGRQDPRHTRYGVYCALALVWTVEEAHRKTVLRRP